MSSSSSSSPPKFDGDSELPPELPPDLPEEALQEAKTEFIQLVPPLDPPAAQEAPLDAPEAAAPAPATPATTTAAPELLSGVSGELMTPSKPSIVLPPATQDPAPALAAPAAPAPSLTLVPPPAPALAPPVQTPAAPASAHAAPAGDESAEVLAAQMASISEAFAREIDEALRHGDSDRARSLVLQMRDQMNRLMHPSSAAAPASVPAALPTLYEQRLCAIDLPALAFEGDRAAFSELLADTETVCAIDRLGDAHFFSTERVAFHRDSFKLNPRIAPRLFEVGDACRKTLGLKLRIEFYVHRREIPKAFLIRSRDPQLIIAVTSPLLTWFDEEELRFVVGQQIGRFLFGHRRLPARRLLGQGKNFASPLLALRLHAWERASQISADRVGLLCCQSIDAAAKALLKLSSGSAATVGFSPIGAVLKELESMDAELVGAEGDAFDLFQAQGFGPIRLKALDLFHRSASYRQLIGLPGGDIPEGALEGEVRKLVSVTEPACLQEDHPIAGLARRFLFLGALLVGVSDGGLAPEESQALEALVKDHLHEARVREMLALPREALLDALRDLGSELKLATSTVVRFGLVRDLVVISLSDGKLPPARLRALHEICRLADVPESLADHIAGNAAAGPV